MPNEHTPGPWTPAAGGYVKTADGKWYVGQAFASPGADEEANALLLAAAPDLLDLAELVMQVSDHPGLREAARLTIAKARGET